ncbi:MAG: hypothetical protein H6636_13840 [Anaerolineales bacterium]|nr:hypothetical protein [Anaerolineales bacterium]
MTATESMIARVRRQVAEPSEATYSDEVLAEYIERYPISDALGETPLLEGGTENPDWEPSYDLFAAAAEIWMEKAAALSTKYSFSADGKRHALEQQWEHAAKMAKYYLARRRVKSSAVTPSGDPPLEQSPALGVIVLPASAVVNRLVEVD